MLTDSDFTTKATDGTIFQIKNGDKITSIGGRLTELYVTGFEIIGSGMRRRPKLVSPVNGGVVVAVRSGYNFDGTIAYSDPLTVPGQSEPDFVDVWNKDLGAKVKKAKEVVCFLEADTTKGYSVFAAFLSDETSGLMDSTAFTVRVCYTVAVGASEVDEIGGTVDPVFEDLEFLSLSLATQYDYDEIGRKYKCGDGHILVNRELISKSQIESMAYIEITPHGETVPQLFQLWNSDGVNYEQTNHYKINLKRINADVTVTPD